ncbi:MAG TPA: oxidoreductase [Porphyromonadaceae bacterium]|jgi:NAD(P)-dependent dehydrogenase (short-subunit alcohol dehydrogenase family)|uniref:SDR family NAD(P)-dependent oxidoreductase n=1 Tax=Limibacterium fermenti TaxID=3229863 RepID=UPI000E7E4596|nr:oxidoreductase [Porphyromonadaceae bacterium]HBL32269.1 oxidoreductase [Porphyromonadaceae bacterium]HBX19846.1 oxidoreductase [Porphyromonadaceae bacterium]HCM19925.1 oxidoreductase [Porphyromonadaceae bacterium]
MNLQLTGKTALVTGSTAGIGYAAALGLLKEGAKVFINGREEKKLEKVVEQIKKDIPSADVEGVVADFSKVEEVDTLIHQIKELDILINNVGIYGDQPFETTPDEVWMHDFEVNVMSGVRLSRHYIPLMKKKNWGRVVFVSSESAINIPDDMILYGVTKTAILALSRGLAKSLRGTNVTVNSVLPGPTWSAGNLRSMKELSEKKGITVEEAALEFVKEKRPESIIQRFAEPEEVANLIVYLASPLSSATTGAALRVDGGIVNTAF